MIRRVLITTLVLGLGLSGTACSDPISPATAAAESNLRLKIDSARWGLQQGNSSVIEASLDGIEQLPEYRDLMPKTKHTILELHGEAAAISEDWPLAHGFFVRATAGPEATDLDWRLRLDSARNLRDFADALVAFRQVRDRRTTFPWDSPDMIMSNLDEGFGTLPNAEAARFEFESALANWNWRPRDQYFSPDVIRLHYAIGLAARGQRDSAQAVVRGFTDPDVEGEVLADKRFDALVATGSTPAKVHQIELERLKTRADLVAANPQSSYALASLAEAYFRLGRYEEAAATAKQALAPRDPSSGNDGNGASGGEGLAHALEVYANIRLGHARQAQQMAEYPGGGGLLLAYVLVGLGQGREALELLEPAGDGDAMPTSVQQQLMALKVCAAHQLGDAQTDDEAFKFVTSHPYLSAYWSMLAFACRDDEQGAADYVVKLLDDPVRRHIVLLQLQIITPLSNPLLHEAAMERLQEQLRHDPRVIAALEPVGRINRYDAAELGPIY